MHNPLVVVLYAGTRGYLSSVAVANVQDYEAKLLNHLRGDQTALLNKIATERKLTDEIEGQIKDVLDAFAGLSGVGKSKLQRYGERFVDAIKEFNSSGVA